MHLQCRKALTRIAVTPWAPRDCGNGKCYSGQWTCRTRNYSGFPALDTNTGHPQPYARRTIGYPTTLSPQLNDTLASARRSMEPINLENTLAHYDWRAFAPAGTQLYYITSEGDANQRVARIASRPGPFTIGLDFEWRPTFVARRPENPIALVQLACDDEILLVQVSAMSGKLFFFTCGPRGTLGAPSWANPHNQLFPAVSATYWSRRRARKSELAYSVSWAWIDLSPFVLTL
jgi:hypothetical protein